MIDLSTDTNTRPTDAMRQAMAVAEVGNDDMGTDPTTNQLQRRTAELLGKEAALFVPSGTMANQLAIRCQTQPGDMILIDHDAHCFWYEAGAPAALSGVLVHKLDHEQGIYTADQVHAAVRPTFHMFAPVTYLSVEQTHNRASGAIWPKDALDAVAHAAHEHNMIAHMDGARLWHASAATGIAMCDYAKHFDSVSVCFSKGLGAPIGSMLAGSAQLIERARRFRKQFGGGMRQSGIVAAGALYALDHHRDRLADDHANAKALAAGLAEIPGVTIDVHSVQTNMLHFDVSNGLAREIEAQLTKQDILLFAVSPDTIRAVTSMLVTQEQMAQVAEAVRLLIDTH
jgi:threonine aldolase